MKNRIRSRMGRLLACLSSSVRLVPLLVLCSAPPAWAQGRIIEIFPSNADATCNEEFENVANTLQPGDQLVLHGGTYSQNCRRAISVNGTAANPITIRAAASEIPILTRPQDPNFNYSQNNIEISGSYLIIQGLHFRGGSSGVRFLGGHHITFQDNEVYETGNNAIPMNSGNTDSFIIRRNHIHHTGLLSSSVGTTEGEGMYVGCNNAVCIASNHLIEGNYVHHMRGTSSGGNDGIEVKVGSYGNIIRNNVIHDANIGRRYPCIFVYGGGRAANTVEGNAVWNCGEGIYAVADAVVRNNIVLNSDWGISSYPHAQVAQKKNLTIVNNTLYGHSSCLFLRWSGASNMSLANNAAYCPGTTAVDASGLTGMTIRSNYVEGRLSGASIDNIGFFSGGSASTTFLNRAGLDFWPTSTSVLLGKADGGFVPALDFNETLRTSPYDVGAYETEGQTTNPGWKIQPGFKGSASQDTTPPTVSITAPASGATLSGTVTVSANASDNLGVVGVQFLLDGVNLGAEDSTAPYSISWNTTTVANGPHTLSARARDAAGNTTTAGNVPVTVSNAVLDTTPPTVSITSPTADATVSGTITVSATASDNVGVVGVQFKVDGVNIGAEDTTAPYSVSWNTTGVSNGSHTLSAAARDAAGNSSTASLNVQVSNSAPVDTRPGSVVGAALDANTQFQVEAEDLSSAVTACTACRFQSAADLLAGQNTEGRLRASSITPVADRVILRQGTIDGTVASVATNQFVVQPASGSIWPGSVLVVVTPNVTEFRNFSGPSGPVQAGQKVAIRGLLFKSGPQGNPTLLAKKIELRP